MSWDAILVWIEGHPGLASWVQAFGSVVAVLIAIWISSAESRARKAGEKRARTDAIVRCQWVLANSGDVVEKITKSLSGDEFSNASAAAYIGRLDTLHNEIRELAYGPGMDSDIFSVVLGARLGVDRLRSKLQERMDSGSKFSDERESLKSYFSSIDGAIKKLDRMQNDS